MKNSFSRAVSQITNFQYQKHVSKVEHNGEWIILRTIAALHQSFSRENWNNFCLLPVICYFAGWEHIYWNNCLQDENYEKTHQLFHRKHGHVRSAVPDIPVPAKSNRALPSFLVNKWSSWPGLVKVGSLLSRCLRCCLCSEPCFDSSGSIWSCSISPSFPTHQFKAVSFLHSRHLDRRNGYPLTIPLRLCTC